MTLDGFVDLFQSNCTDPTLKLRFFLYTNRSHSVFIYKDGRCGLNLQPLSFDNIKKVNYIDLAQIIKCN